MNSIAKSISSRCRKAVLLVAHCNYQNNRPLYRRRSWQDLRLKGFFRTTHRWLWIFRSLLEGRFPLKELIGAQSTGPQRQEDAFPRKGGNHLNRKRQHRVLETNSARVHSWTKVSSDGYNQVTPLSEPVSFVEDNTEKLLMSWNRLALNYDGTSYSASFLFPCSELDNNSWSHLGYVFCNISNHSGQ